MPATTAPWFTDHANLALLAAWMLGDDYTGRDVVKMLEKPWNWEREFTQARLEAEAPCTPRP